MHTRKITRNWAIAGAVAAMMAASTMGVRAQDAAAPMATPPAAPAPDATTPPAAPAPDATTPPATPAPDASMPMPPTPAPMAMSGSMSGTAPTDYSVLSNRYFDYVDLQQARARGLSDSQIATVVKISKLTGYSFRMVSAAVERGETFPSLATQYNLRLNDVYEIDKEKQDIADYTSLYEVASSFSKNNSGAMMAGSMAPGPMTPPMADNSTPPMDASKPMAGGMATLDIVDTAMAAKNLTTLVKALQVAGLVETLKGSGPFTVFAPDDKAFSKLPAGALDALLADPAKLKTVLTYHVIPASIMAADAEAMTSPTSPPTVQGGTLQVTKGRRGRLKINDANVTKGDIKASNGVIHIIDKVLMPPTDATAPAPDATATPPAAPTPDATMTPPAPAPGDTTTPPAAPAAPGDTTTPPAAPAAPGDTTTPPAAPPAPAPAQ